MFGKQIKLIKLYGFQVKIDTSWIFLVFLVTWSLAKGYFPTEIKGLDNYAYWLMGIGGALGLFVSLILHEFSHSVVARKMGLPIRGITLFIFGGVAEMEKEPENAKTEFYMAIAGPLMSVFLGFVFLFLTSWGENLFSHSTIVVLNYLSIVNFFLAAFNMLPGFPLDGGRVFRSALWAWKNDFRWATHWAVKSGSFIGTVLMILGVLAFISGNIITGIWWFLIAMFLKGAAKSSEYQVILKEHFKGEPIHQYMNPRPISIPSHLSVDQAVHDYFYRYHHNHYPVINGDELLGLVSIKDIKSVPREEWSNTSIQAIYQKLSEQNNVLPQSDAYEVLQKMNKEKIYTLLVSDTELRGIVTLRDLLSYLNFKLDLEG